MSMTTSPVAAKLWKLTLVAALALTAFGLPTPRRAEASPCTLQCSADHTACRVACQSTCGGRNDCLADCYDACWVARQECIAGC